jgi:hypothetical protein
MSNAGASSGVDMREGQAMQQGPTNDEVDLARMVEVFDTALSSDNPAIKDLFQKLIMMSVLLTSENPSQRIVGPFKQMFQRVRDLENSVRRLEIDARSGMDNKVISGAMAQAIKTAGVMAPPPITVTKEEWEVIQKNKTDWAKMVQTPSKFTTPR